MALLYVANRYPRNVVLALLAFTLDTLLIVRFDAYGLFTVGACVAVILYPSPQRKPAMPSLKAIRAANSGAAREVTATYGEAAVQVVFDPGKVTGAVVQQIQEEQTPGALAAGLAQIIVSWDLTDDEAPAKGKKAAAYPHDPDSLLRLPMAFLSAVMTAIGEDLQPTGEASGSFGAG